MFVLLVNMAREELVQQLQDGLVLLVLGMGTVFVFLILLIYSTKIMSRICKNFEKKTAVSPSSESLKTVRTVMSPETKDEDLIAAAIALAYDKER